ncbi:hypothetical protein ACKWTF_001420 [Chironomus riparius]
MERGKIYQGMPESRNMTINEFVAINKGRNTRQVTMDIPKNGHPLSNYISSKHHSERKNPTIIQSKPPTSRARDNVKFEYTDNIPRSCHQEQIRKVCNNKHYSAQKKELYDSIANDNIYNSCMESEIDSVYSSSCYHDDDNESEMESLYDRDEYTHRALLRMETKVNTITNKFVNKVKSEVDETFSKLKIQSKFNSTKGKTTKVDKGSGDTAKKSHDTVENDTVIKDMLKNKRECYEKIEQQLKILQQLDQLTDKLYKNHMK